MIRIINIWRRASVFYWSNIEHVVVRAALSYLQCGRFRLAEGLILPVAVYGTDRCLQQVRWNFIGLWPCLPSLLVFMLSAVLLLNLDRLEANQLSCELFLLLDDANHCCIIAEDLVLAGQIDSFLHCIFEVTQRTTVWNASILP